MDKIEIAIEWQNETSFEMRFKNKASEETIVVRLEENGCIGKIWPEIAIACKKFFDYQVDVIGGEMLALAP